MALLRFNTNTLHLDILIGINEKFEPKQEILELNGKIVELRNKVNDFLNETFNTSNQQEIIKIMTTDKELEGKWKQFLTNVYNVEIKILSEQVQNINKIICLNYSEFIAE